MYKIETHLHTRYASECAWMLADEIVTLYKNGGYHAIAITDHFSRKWPRYAGINLRTAKDPTEFFLAGYRTLKTAAEKQGLRVYAGAEVRFEGSENDYLLYGFEKSLLSDPDRIFREGLPAFYEKCREHGALLIQAHPFRDKCFPADPSMIDGVEVYNASKWHDNQNDKALAFAKAHGLIMLAGSDCHRPEDACRGGILCDTLPEDTFGLAALIRSGQYRLIQAGQGPV